MPSFASGSCVRLQLELELREAERHAAAMATHDFLTGLPNRRLLEDRLQLAIETSKREKRQCGVRRKPLSPSNRTARAQCTASRFPEHRVAPARTRMLRCAIPAQRWMA